MIEDNSDDEALLLRQLKKAKLERHIRVIHDGGKALEYLMDERFKCEDLAAIFLDLRLPTIDGLRILEAIKSEGRLQNVPVVVMTSSNAPEELEKCHELGVSSYINKPVTFSSFAKAFADTFQNRRVSNPID
jgi:two-component system, response regulator